MNRRNSRTSKAKQKRINAKKKAEARKRDYELLHSSRMNATMKRKLAGLFVVIVLALVGLAGRITFINTTKGEQYRKQVLVQSQQQYGSTTLPFKRGDIVDCNGTVLASSEKVYNLILDCKVVNSHDKGIYVEPTVETLVNVLGQDEAKVRSLLTDAKTKGSQYQILATGLSITDKKSFEEYMEGTDEEPLTDEEKTYRSKIKGIWFEDMYRRVYPLGSVACDVIGFTYDGNHAEWGLEGYYGNVLNGVDGRRYGYFNENSDMEQTLISPVDGKSIVTTLDANIQQIVEKYIAQFETDVSGVEGGVGAANIGVIVMDPNDGSVLAMASNDPYDLNNPRDLSLFYTEEVVAAMSSEQKIEALNGIWKNYCISSSFEPGSTVKPLVIASALDNGTLTGTEVFECDGFENISGSRIKCSNNDGHGQLTLSEVVQYSCNDGMMHMAEDMGVEEFIKYQKVFNFGSKTGIDLSGEASGILFTTETMGTVELATSSFGQGYTCTMIQEAAAMCSAINGGYYYRPQLVRKILSPDGTTAQHIEPVLLKQTISSEVSSEIRSYMKAAVEDGTCVISKVDGYSSGGKTGTAQKIPRGNGKYLVSFIGFAPAENPEVLIYVVVDEPQVEHQDDSSFPQYIAKNVMSEILPYMNIFRDEEMTGENITSTDLKDGIADLNVPEPEENKEVIVGGDTLESMGITNEEANLQE